MRGRGARLILAAATALAASALPGVASTAASDDGATVTQRIVWDRYVDGRRGIHLWSANPDGTDRRRLYETNRGFTIDLALSHDGEQVAFSPCCQRRFPYLTMVGVNDRVVRDPLAEHRKAFFAVGGIAFSPDDTHLVFQANSMAGDQVVTALWTVATDGTDLRRILGLTWDQDQGFMNDSLVWTDDGILYSDGEDLRLAAPPADGEEQATSSLVVPGVYAVRGSGDGGSIVTLRSSEAEAGVWISAPDGSDARRVIPRRTPDQSRAWLTNITPSYDGSRLLALRVSTTARGTEVVTWEVGQRPRDGAVVPLPGVFMALTWN